MDKKYVKPVVCLVISKEQDVVTLSGAFSTPDAESDYFDGNFEG